MVWKRRGLLQNYCYFFFELTINIYFCSVNLSRLGTVSIQIKIEQLNTFFLRISIIINYQT